MILCKSNRLTVCFRIIFPPANRRAISENKPMIKFTAFCFRIPFRFFKRFRSVFVMEINLWRQIALLVGGWQCWFEGELSHRYITNKKSCSLTNKPFNQSSPNGMHELFAYEVWHCEEPSLKTRAPRMHRKISAVYVRNRLVSSAVHVIYSSLSDPQRAPRPTPVLHR